MARALGLLGTGSVVLALGWVVAGAAGADGTSRPPALLTHDALQARLADPHLRLLDVRPREAFETGHLPGAVRVDPKATASLAARAGGLTDRDAWEAWAAPLGIGPETEVYVYDDQRQVDAARVWWLLRYLGVEKVGLIDGGFSLWAGRGRPVSKAPTSVPPQPLRVAFRKERLATREDALAALASGRDQFVDARSRDEYTGAQAKSRRGGHVPTACHLEWTELVDPQGRFREPTVLTSRLARSGVKPGGAVITHCQGGGRASVDAFVLERLGIPTRNYYLGWSDWGNADETPVANGPEPGAKP
jgi:thiosulfate/3-mercaptopyruvate sulfurtransferase